MKKVLVVEDDQFLADSYLTKLKHENIQVTVASNGQEALKVLQEDSDIHLIILDLLMPVMDGQTTLTRLKTNAKTKDIPVIVATNNDDQQANQACLDLGAKEYFIKSSITINSLVDTVKKYLN